MITYVSMITAPSIQLRLVIKTQAVSDIKPSSVEAQSCYNRHDDKVEEADSGTFGERGSAGGAVPRCDAQLDDQFRETDGGLQERG